MIQRHPFDLLMELDTDEIRLDCAALHIARDVHPHVDIHGYLARLDRIAEDVSDTRPGLAATLRYRAMREVLVENYELKGNEDDYYDPDNSYMNRVLDRKIGNPITLSTIWIEVARRLKWPVAGVAFPGHFLIRFDDAERFVVADPFNAGQSLSIDDCKQLLQVHFGDKVKFSPSLLEPVDTRAILTRMLNNLRSVYHANNDWPRLASVLQRLAAIEPQNGSHLQELAAVHYRCGNVRGAYAHLAVCLRRAPDGRDSRVVRENLQVLERAIASLN